MSSDQPVIEDTIVWLTHHYYIGCIHQYNQVWVLVHHLVNWHKHQLMVDYWVVVHCT